MEVDETTQIDRSNLQKSKVTSELIGPTLHLQKGGTWARISPNRSSRPIPIPVAENKEGLKTRSHVEMAKESSVGIVFGPPNGWERWMKRDEAHGRLCSAEAISCDDTVVWPIFSKKLVWEI